MSLSIVINNYNYGRFLRAAIESALQQTYPATEIIVVDDGSTDDSRAIIAEFGDRIIPVLKPNGGQASALNAGFARCRGEFLIFLDADDELLPDTVAHVIAAFKGEPDAAKVMYRLAVIDASGRPTGAVQPPLRLLRSGDMRRHVLTFPFDMAWPATSGNAFAARVLREIFPIPEEAYGRIAADYYLSHVTPLFGPVVFLDAVGANYRVHGTNNYATAGTRLNLDYARQTIIYSNLTRRYIVHYADRLALEGRPGSAEDLLSVSFIAQRMVSRRLDPARHPIRGDSPGRLLLLGGRATLRRFDMAPLLRLIFVFWFAAMAVAPRLVAQRLAELFFFPESRGRLNRLLGFQRAEARAATRAKAR